MKTKLALCAAALAAAFAIAGPAVAGPAHAVVHGAIPLYVPPDAFYDNSTGYGDYYGGFYGNPQDRYYDPAGAMPDWRYHGPAAVDLVLARTLDRTGESILGHILICQARHVSYSAASNTYFGRNGIPVACQD
ncbi:MAG: hypothetical protein P4M09_12620 [Devosia sp.]|nr:hypothetical protein [Devosia sp.]